NAETSVGVQRSVVVPSPIWPRLFFPQHLIDAAVVRAHVWYPPAEIAATPDVRPLTSTGSARAVVVPSPSWPKSFAPQHFTPPAEVRAQLCAPPADIAMTPLVSP